MPSNSGEGYPGSHPDSSATEEFLNSQQEIQILLEALGADSDPRQYAKYANGSRNLYFKYGDREKMRAAEHFYDMALSGLDKDDALKSWVLCNRLNLYIHEYRHGGFDGMQLLDEVEAAIETARHIPFRERRRGKADLWWLLERRATISNEMLIEASGQRKETYHDRRLEIVGGTAVAPVIPRPEIILEPEPAPNAA